jgi:hypothetical protein
VLLLTAPALLLAAPPLALADGDPASDVLLSQDVFLPYSQISSSAEHQLYTVCDQARRSGYPLKIALITGKSDLGVVPALFGRPEAYARFLSTEIANVARGPVLVVMPSGFGLAVQGRPRSVAPFAGIQAGPSADALAAAALSAVTRLSRAAGHPVSPSASSAGTSAGASAGTVRHAVTAMLLLALCAAVAVAGALAARARQPQ